MEPINGGETDASWAHCLRGGRSHRRRAARRERADRAETRRRSSEPERPVAVDEHGLLEPRGPRGLAVERFLAARLDRRNPGRSERREGRQDPLQARGARETRAEPGGLAEDRSGSGLLLTRYSARHVPAVSVPDR